MLSVTPGSVAVFAPDAPPVTAALVQEALDWAEPALERQGVVLTPGSRQERAAVRAVCCYALYLAAGGQAAALRTSDSAVKAVVSERKKVGPLEKEQKFTDAQSSAGGMLTSAREWLTRAWLALYAAGVSRGSLVVGVSR